MQLDVPAVSASSVDRLVSDVDNNFIIGVPKVSIVALCSCYCCCPADAALHAFVSCRFTGCFRPATVSGIPAAAAIPAVTGVHASVGIPTVVGFTSSFPAVADFTSYPDIPVVAGSYIVLLFFASLLFLVYPLLYFCYYANL